MNRLLSIACISLGVAACDAAPPVEDVPGSAGPVDVEKPSDGKQVGKADQWGPSDNPAIFTPDLNFKVADLPLDGEAANIPWAASYWPVWEDTINHRWAGASTDSPALKYGKAFNVADI